MIVSSFDPLKELDRLFPGQTTSANMPMDIVRRNHEVLVTVELPGFRHEDIDITVERNVLTITAERTEDRREGDRVVTRERRWGRVSRQLVLSEALDPARMDANLDEGVLSLRIPVAEQAKPQRISIDVGSKGAINASSNET